MIALTELQVWTLIGVFAAAIFGVQGIAMTSFRRELKSLGEGLRTEVRSEIGGLRNEMNARFDTVNNRLVALDRDVQFLMRKEFD